MTNTTTATKAEMQATLDGLWADLEGLNPESESFRAGADRLQAALDELQAEILAYARQCGLEAMIPWVQGIMNGAQCSFLS